MIDNFWRDLPAPMEEVTDVVFRHVVSAAARSDVFFTEFTNTESYCHPGLETGDIGNDYFGCT
jgi:tRNA-dihydrouridine synthase